MSKSILKDNSKREAALMREHARKVLRSSTELANCALTTNQITYLEGYCIRRQHKERLSRRELDFLSEAPSLKEAARIREHALEVLKTAADPSEFRLSEEQIAYLKRYCVERKKRGSIPVRWQAFLNVADVLVPYHPDKIQLPAPEPVVQVSQVRISNTNMIRIFSLPKITEEEQKEEGQGAEERKIEAEGGDEEIDRFYLGEPLIPPPPSAVPGVMPLCVSNAAKRIGTWGACAIL